MSSSSSASASARRLKERSSSSGVVVGAGGKVTAPLKTSKTLTPISEKENNGSCKRPTGKENPRSVSRSKTLGVCQKPVPIPKIDKQTVGSIKDGGETKVRWSTSSVPRGRSSSPSDFTRFLSDFRKERMPTRGSLSERSVKTLERGGNVGGTVVSKGGKPVNGFRVLERSQQKRGNLDENVKESERIENGNRGLGERKGRSSNECVRSEENVEHSLDVNVKPILKNLNGVKAVRNTKEEINLKPNLARSDIKDVLPGVKVIEDGKDTSYLVLNSEDKVESSANGSRVLEKFRDSIHLGSNLKGVGSKALNGFKLSEIQKERGTSAEDKSVRVTDKYPSKLHEKLALLEGKVKRIASDIKKTKEMLDMNNPDESKTIISDIQDKISGIEKDMVHVKTDKDDSSVSSKTVDKDNVQPKNLEKSQNDQVSHSKVSVTGLNHEELEARLFPHHKLLRGRTSLSSLSASSQSDKSHYTEPSSHSKPEEVPLSPIDNNPIALEFLASLHKEESKENARDEHAGLEFTEIQEMDGAATSAAEDNSNMVVAENCEEEIAANDVIEDFNNQENRPARVIPDEIEELSVDQLHVIGHKTSTGGWFVSEGESVLLAHDDGSCSYYDITNSEEKAEYKPPTGLSPNIWGDCWLIRAAGADGCSGRYVVAASSGSALESGFCSWDFYTKDVKAFHVEDKTITTARKVLGPLPNIGLYRRNASSTIMIPENRQWWYKPCGPLLVSTSSSQKVVKVYDIRDSEEVMQWELQRPVIGMDHSSPLHWRNRGKVVLAETEAISLWDVNSLTPQALLTVSSSGRRVSALHVNNTDAELGGGVRRRVSSSEVEGNDGVFCTQDTINVLDFRLPSGVGLRISKHGMSVQSIFSRGDSIFLGCTDGRLSMKGQASSRVQQFSLRKGRLAGTYALPESNAHFHFSAISQVWGNSDFVMGVSPLGLFVFDSLQDEGASSLVADEVKTQGVKEIIGPDDMYSPSFDYLASRVLVISRDRPAFWRYL